MVSIVTLGVVAALLAADAVYDCDDDDE